MRVLPDTRGAGACTPLYNAAELGFTEVARVLIHAKADVNIPKDNGATPLLTSTEQVRKRHFLYKNDHFAKTGSGQT